MESRILTLLAGGKTCSGEEMAVELGVSRAAINKQIKKMRAMGANIDAARGSGYRLQSPVDVLDAETINEMLNDRTRICFPDMAVLWTVDSTNEECLRWAGREGRAGFVCLSEHQSQGRGRRGRVWYGPLGASLLFSLVWQFARGAGSLGGLSLAVGIGVADVLSAEFGLQNVELKWPNDIYCSGKKLGGILIEFQGDAVGPSLVVVGVGINVALPADLQLSGVDQQWTDMWTEGAQGASQRNRLAARLLERLALVLSQYEVSGLQPMLASWDAYDCFRGRVVCVCYPDGTRKEGVARGISGSGALMLECGGVTEEVWAGEVSLRRVDSSV